MTPSEAKPLASANGGEPGLPDDDSDMAFLDDGDADDRSLIEDVHALIDDGKTYLEAEIAYQKTRAAFVADKAKNALIYGAIAAMFGVLALIGLTVGLIIALTPLLTAWGASAVVVGLLLVGAFVALRAAAKHWSRLMGAIDSVEAKP